MCSCYPWKPHSHVTICIIFERYLSCFSFFSAIGDGAVRANLIVFGADQIPESQTNSKYCDKFIVMMSLAAILESLNKLFFLQNQDYFTFYAVATGTFLIAGLLFIIGWRYYIDMKPYDSVLINCIPVYKNAFETWRQYKKNLNNEERRVDERPLRFLDFAKIIHYGKFQDRIVNDVKSLQSALIISILVLPYWLILSQVK
jgi:hypothetical protein